MNLKNLYVDAVESTPRFFDFGTGYTETWEFYQAAHCDECNTISICSGQEQCGNIHDNKCDGYIDCEGPMMNYFYPLPKNFEDRWELEEAVTAIASIPLCIVFDIYTEEYGLALAGGGMDLSWEICEGYMLLGYLPPFHFCNLPVMADGRKSRTWIADGCKKSAQYIMNKSSNLQKHLDNVKE